MPRFAFTAIDSSGKQISDTLVADSAKQLENSLQKQGMWLMKANESQRTETGERSTRSQARIKVKRWDLINLYTQLALLLQAGITLTNALERLAQDMSGEKLGTVVDSVGQQVQAGNPLPSSLAHFPRVFDGQTVALVEAGEASGNLPEVFHSLAANLEWYDGLIASARQALVYPAAVFAASIGLVTLLLTVVVPRFQALFQDLAIELPAITRLIISLSDLLLSTWYLWLSAVAIGMTLLATAKRLPAVRATKDAFLLKVPFFGEIVRSLALSQFSSTLEMLLRSGIPLARSLQLCAKQASNFLVGKAISEARSAVLEGQPMTSELSKHSVFTQTFLTMAQTGETSGNLDHALKRVADYYNTIVPRKIKAFFGVFEPFIIISLTSTVGVVALSLVLPILSLWNAN